MAENVLTKERITKAERNRVEVIKGMSEKELLQNIAYDIDRIARLVTVYFTVFAFIFVLWLIFTFAGPFIQKAVGL